MFYHLRLKGFHNLIPKYTSTSQSDIQKLTYKLYKQINTKDTQETI